MKTCGVDMWRPMNDALVKEKAHKTRGASKTYSWPWRGLEAHREAKAHT